MEQMQQQPASQSCWCLVLDALEGLEPDRAVSLLRRSVAGCTPPPHPPHPTGGPAHLHEVPVVLQHAAGRLPGVLVALPRVHPGRVGERFRLVPSLSLVSQGLPPKTAAQGAEHTGRAVHLDLKSDKTRA